MGDPVLYILVVILVALSAFFSASETAYSSVSRVRLKNYQAEGDKRAGRALKIADHFDRALSAILIGNNVVNIASATIGTMICTSLLGDGPLAATVSTLAMTVLVLIFGEVLPKSFAKENAEQFALVVAAPLSLLITVLKPLIAALIGLKKLASMLIKTKEKAPSVTEEELKYIIEEIEDEGVLEEEESELVQSALEFDDITVSEILTPRVDVDAINVNDPVEKMLELFKNSSHSRIPVYEKSVDHILGIVTAYRFLHTYLENPAVDIRSLIQDTLFVPPTKKISELLQELQRQKMQFAVVVDQYGGTIGIVTVEDILEELVGEIWDENEDMEEEVRRIDTHLYEVEGDTKLYDLFEELELEFPGFKSSSNSIGGWALEMLEHIPTLGESFRYENLTIMVKELEDQRITKLTVALAPSEEATEQ